MGVKFWGEEFQKANGLAAQHTQKNNLIFDGNFFAKLQSVAISQLSLRFLALSSLFQKKTVKATAAIKPDRTKFVN